MSYEMILLVGLTHFGAIPAILFPIVYNRARWKATLMGRVLMLMNASLAVLFAEAILGYWFDYSSEMWIHVVATGFVAFALWFKLFILLRIQKQDRAVLKEKRRLAQTSGDYSSF